MISETAMDALDQLAAEGLHPSSRDVVRLNAIGLKLEAARAKSVRDSTYLLPRVAQVSPELFFRQPTVGHEIWMAKVDRLIDRTDLQTVLAVRAFALSRAAADLPDPDSPGAVDLAIRDFAASCAPYTREQLIAAVAYAMHGFDPSAGETAASPASGDTSEENPDWRECVAVGVLNEGRAVLWGLTAADMASMTVRQLSDVIDRAKIYHNMRTGSGEDFWQGRFFATLDEIAGRLRKESSHG